MYLIGVLVLSVLSTASAGWLVDVVREGLQHLGDGVSVHLDSIESKGFSPLERYVLRIDCSETSVSLAKEPHEDKLNVALYRNEPEEGRARRIGRLIIPIFLGLKAIIVATIVTTALVGLVLQSLMVAKISLALSSFLGLKKLFSSSSKNGVQHVVAVDYKTLPAVHQIENFGGAYPDYTNYPKQHDASASTAEYAIVDAPEGNLTKQPMSLTSSGFTPLHERNEISKKQQYDNNFARFRDLYRRRLNVV